MVNYCFVNAILPGKIDLVKKFANENGANNTEHNEFFNIIGISREQVWIQPAPTNNNEGIPDICIVSWETDDPVKTFKDFAMSDHPWAIKFWEFAKEAFGIDIKKVTSPPPLNDLVVDWYKEK
jgi:hypothetical protein